MISTQPDSIVTNTLDLSQLASDAKAYQELLADILINNPPDGFDFGGFPQEWMQPSKWESLIQNFTSQFTMNMQHLQQNG